MPTYFVELGSTIELNWAYRFLFLIYFGWSFCETSIVGLIMPEADRSGNLCIFFLLWDFMLSNP